MVLKYLTNKTNLSQLIFSLIFHLHLQRARSRCRTRTWRRRAGSSEWCWRSLSCCCCWSSSALWSATEAASTTCTIASWRTADGITQRRVASTSTLSRKFTFLSQTSLKMRLESTHPSEKPADKNQLTNFKHLQTTIDKTPRAKHITYFRIVIVDDELCGEYRRPRLN